MRFIVLLVASLLAGAGARAELKLVADVDGRHLPVVGIGERSTVLVEDAGKQTARQPGDAYAIEGDFVVEARFVAWSPSYRIDRAESPDGPLFTGRVSLLHRSEWMKEKVNSPLLQIWPDGVRDRASSSQAGSRRAGSRRWR